MSHELKKALFAAGILITGGLARADLIDEDDQPPKQRPEQAPPGPATGPGAGPRPGAPRPPVDDDEPLGSSQPTPPKPLVGPRAPTNRTPRAISEGDAVQRPSGGTVLPPKGGGSKSDKEAAKLPILFKSNGARGLREKGTFELMEDVVITQGEMKMEAAHALIQGDEKAKDIMKVTADGDVKMFMVDADSGEKVKAFGDRVVFDNKSRTVLLEGNARLWRGADLVRGKTIVYEMDTGWIRADRVAGEVHPDTIKAKP